MERLTFSLIVPVYNRPHEIEELLESLSRQTDRNFEVVIVEDGSTITCTGPVEQYRGILDIKYFFKPNTGPGQSRNYGMERASGNYYVILDSDCIMPREYIATVRRSLAENYVDTFGGPDRADRSFTNLQQAVDYSMTSFFTTGGIRGGKRQLDRYYPRSFNMGISKEVFLKTGGFPSVRYAASKAAGEDIELSINIYRQGFRVGLIADAYVYHKRRTGIRQFFRQVYSFGYARVTLSRRNRGTLKPVHLLPLAFTLGSAGLILGAILTSWLFLLPLMLFLLLVNVDATIRKRSLLIGKLAMLISLIQLYGYGLGFMKGVWDVIRGKSIGATG